MDKFFEYSLESAISLAVFYLFYWIFMRKSTHFSLNRFILVFSVISSMILPALANRLNMPATGALDLAIDFSTSPIQSPATPAATQTQGTENGYSLLEIFGLIYLAGAAMILARLAYQAIYLHAVSRLSKTTVYQGFKIISLDTDMIPFSYFNKIFIPSDRISEDSLDSVIMHEKSHLAQGHYLDLFILQVVTVLQWFNPFIWLFEKSLKEVHEYLADEAVLEAGKDKGNYQAILVNEALGGPVFILTNQLNKSLIKKRILMMKNVKTPKMAQLKALLILPLFAALMLAFNNPAVLSQAGNDEIIIKGTISDRYTGSPIPGANIIVEGTNIGTICDLKGNYQIRINSADEALIFSVTGYRTQKVMVGKNRTINVELEPDIMAIDFSKEKQFEPYESPVQKDKGEPSGDDSFVFIEELPSYPGGTAALQKFILDNLQYPAEAKRAGLEGTVLVGYTIDNRGAVTNVKIIRGIQNDMDNEALRVTRLIKGWIPGSQGGRPVPTAVTMPVEFKLRD